MDYKGASVVSLCLPFSYILPYPSVCQAKIAPLFLRYACFGKDYDVEPLKLTCRLITWL